MAKLSIRIDLDGGLRLGPGKMDLLERISRHGSISAAGRDMAMSYRRAWQLIEDLNAHFPEPLVITQAGGTKGGGAILTQLGRDVLKRYTLVQSAAVAAAQPHLHAIQKAARGGHNG